VSQRVRRTVAETLRTRGTPRRSVVRLSCGHIAFRQYLMAVGQTAYCYQCAVQA